MISPLHDLVISLLFGGATTGNGPGPARTNPRWHIQLLSRLIIQEAARRTCLVGFRSMNNKVLIQVVKIQTKRYFFFEAIELRTFRGLQASNGMGTQHIKGHSNPNQGSPFCVIAIDPWHVHARSEHRAPRPEYDPTISNSNFWITRRATDLNCIVLEAAWFAVLQGRFYDLLCFYGGDQDPHW